MIATHIVFPVAVGFWGLNLLLIQKQAKSSLSLQTADSAVSDSARCVSGGDS